MLKFVGQRGFTVCDMNSRTPSFTPLPNEKLEDDVREVLYTEKKKVSHVI